MTPLVMTLIAGLLSQASVPAPATALFEGLDSGSVYSGCSCVFWATTSDSAEARTVVFSSNYEDSARVQIAGNVVTLSPIQPDSACLPQIGSVGDRCLLEYRGKDLTVTVDVQATWACPTTEESCEVVRLRGEMKGTGVNGDQVMQVKGECGC